MSRRSGFPTWNPEGRGCKGGTGPTKGKKSCLYRVTFPDGRYADVRSFKAQGQLAHAPIYFHDGQWHPNGVFDELPEWAKRDGRTVVQACRL